VLIALSSIGERGLGFKDIWADAEQYYTGIGKNTSPFFSVV
jgi:hypothetical protein